MLHLVLSRLYMNRAPMAADRRRLGHASAWAAGHLGKAQLLHSERQRGTGSLLSGCHLHMRIARFEHDTPVQSGGAVHIHGESRAELNSCSVKGNQAEKDGGAVRIFAGGWAELSACSLEDNTARTGAALHIIAGQAEIQSCSLKGNVAKVRRHTKVMMEGDAVHLQGGSGGALFLGFNSRAGFRLCTLTENTAGVRCILT